jgi:hypothetical protein
MIIDVSIKMAIFYRDMLQTVSDSSYVSGAGSSRNENICGDCCFISTFIKYHNSAVRHPVVYVTNEHVRRSSLKMDDLDGSV